MKGLYFHFALDPDNVIASPEENQSVDVVKNNYREIMTKYRQKENLSFNRETDGG